MNTVLLLVPVTIVILAAAALPAYVVWNAAPVVDPDLDFYIRLAATMISAIVGAFLGAFIIKMSVDISKRLAE